MKRAALLLSIILSVTACTHVAGRYSISVENVVALRSLSGKTANVGPFTTSATVNPHKVQCVGTQIAPPDNLSFPEYVRQALVDELRMAEIYSPSAPVTVTAILNVIEVSASAFTTTGEWHLALTIRSTNGRSLSANERYMYRTNFIETACEVSARTLVAAVQNLIGKLVRSPEFASLIES